MTSSDSTSSSGGMPPGEDGPPGPRSSHDAVVRLEGQVSVFSDQLNALNKRITELTSITGPVTYIVGGGLAIALAVAGFAWRNHQGTTAEFTAVRASLGEEFKSVREELSMSRLELERLFNEQSVELTRLINENESSTRDGFETLRRDLSLSGMVGKQIPDDAEPSTTFDESPAKAVPATAPLEMAMMTEGETPVEALMHLSGGGDGAVVDFSDVPFGESPTSSSASPELAKALPAKVSTRSTRSGEASVFGEPALGGLALGGPTFEASALRVSNPGASPSGMTRKTTGMPARPPLLQAARPSAGGKGRGPVTTRYIRPPFRAAANAP